MTSTLGRVRHAAAARRQIKMTSAASTATAAATSTETYEQLTKKLTRSSTLGGICGVLTWYEPLLVKASLRICCAREELRRQVVMGCWRWY